MCLEVRRGEIDANVWMQTLAAMHGTDVVVLLKPDDNAVVAVFAKLSIAIRGVMPVAVFDRPALPFN